jgi:hypothetical protein
MPQMGYDTKTDRLTDCQSQCDSDSERSGKSYHCWESKPGCPARSPSLYRCQVYLATGPAIRTFYNNVIYELYEEFMILK